MRLEDADHHQCEIVRRGPQARSGEFRIDAKAARQLLAVIAGSSVKAKPVAPTPKNDPIADLLAPSRRVVAVQRALSDFGYGPLKATGAYDADTRRAIERFERENKLPVTGQITERLTRQLTVMTGRPLE